VEQLGNTMGYQPHFPPAMLCKIMCFLVGVHTDRRVRNAAQRTVFGKDCIFMALFSVELLDSIILLMRCW